MSFIPAGLFGSGSFDPMSLNPIVWAYSSDVVLHPTSNRVDTLIEQVSGNNFTEQYGVDTAGPVYTPNAHGNFPALTFAGGSNTIERLAKFPQHNYVGMTGFIVINKPNPNSSFLLGSSSNAGGLYYNDNNSIYTIGAYTGFNSVASNLATGKIPGIHIVKWDFTQTTARLGINDGWGATVTHSGSYLWNQIGAQRTFGSQQFGGDFFEMLAFPTLSPVNILKVEKYLIQKYGIAI